MSGYRWQESTWIIQFKRQGSTVIESMQVQASSKESAQSKVRQAVGSITVCGSQNI